MSEVIVYVTGYLSLQLKFQMTLLTDLVHICCTFLLNVITVADSVGKKDMGLCFLDNAYLALHRFPGYAIVRQLQARMVSFSGIFLYISV